MSDQLQQDYVAADHVDDKTDHTKPAIIAMRYETEPVGEIISR